MPPISETSGARLRVMFIVGSSQEDRCTGAGCKAGTQSDRPIAVGLQTVPGAKHAKHPLASRSGGQHQRSTSA